jgi:hypothetical protein
MNLQEAIRNLQSLSKPIEENIRTTKDLRDKIALDIERILTASSLDELKKILAAQTVLRRDALNEIIVTLETQLQNIQIQIQAARETMQG